MIYLSQMTTDLVCVTLSFHKGLLALAGLCPYLQTASHDSCGLPHTCEGVDHVWESMNLFYLYPDRSTLCVTAIHTIHLL